MTSTTAEILPGPKPRSSQLVMKAGGDAVSRYLKTCYPTATSLRDRKTEDIVHYVPEQTTNPKGVPILGASPDDDHMLNFIKCRRTRRRPNAPKEIGLAPISVHMRNSAYREKRRLTIEETVK